MTINTTPIWLRFAIIIGLCFIVFSLFRGCQRFRAKLASADMYKEALDSTATVNKDLSHQMEIIKQESADTLAVRDAELSLSNNKLAYYDDTLDAANKRINALLKKYKPIEPSVDTNVTVVPNEYIEECSGCFTELKNGQELVSRYKAEKDNQSMILNSKINGQSVTITKLERLNGQLQSNLNNLINVAKDNQKKLEQRRMLYFSMSTISLNQVLPTGIGGGFMYMDKRMRLFGGNAFVTNHGPVYQVQLSMPLSFKR